MTLAAVKEFLRLGHDGEDGLATDLLESARAQVENETGLALITRTLRLTLGDWPAAMNGRGYCLRPGPVTALLTVNTVDSNGGMTDVTARFMLNAGRFCLRPWSFAPPIPQGGHVEIEFVTGFGDISAVPEDLQLAVKLLAAHAYQRRDSATGAARGGLPSDVAQILMPYREVRI